MRISLSPSLHYPFTIRKIIKRVDDEIRPRDALFTYTYTAKVAQQQRHIDQEIIVDKDFSAHFTTAIEGKIKNWFVWEGDVIKGPRDICEVEEPCKHAVQFAGFCVDCGKDMTGIDAVNDANPVRANIQGAHDSDKLLISKEEADDVDNESKKRLLAARKLSLVVDLDQTIIHAAVDPTIGEWQRDPENPNYKAVKDVRPFQLVDETGSKQECWYYIKLRPGLQDFLESVAEKYELHIYTMGTRQYAKKIAELVDPDGKFFGDRILSRDESGSMHAKNLARIFPVDTRMVVIIDDRADVWKWSANLIRVTQFEFFSGIGDINAGYLAKKQDIQTTEMQEHATPDTQPGTVASNGRSTGDPKMSETIDDTADPEANVSDGQEPTLVVTPPLQQVLAMTDAASEENHVKSTDDAIVNQLEEKPLSKLQQKMDEKDGIDSNEPISTQNTDSDSSDSETSSNSGKRRHGVLRNDDEELIHLERSLQAVHDRFFAEFDRKRLPHSAGKGGRLGELAGKGKAPVPDENPDVRDIPDIKRIMPAMKRRVLEGVTIVFSSVVPLKHDIQDSDIALWSKSFGAQVSDKITKETTHLVAARVGTAKVKTAVKKGIKVVGTDWLIKSIQRWKKLDERPYMLKGIGQREMPAEGVQDDAEDSFLNANRLGVSEADLSSEDDTALADTDENEDDQHKKKRPRLDLTDVDGQVTDDDDPLQSPQVTLTADDWDQMNDELLAEFGSDLDSESDAESIRSDRSTLSIRKGKRAREDTTDDDSGASDADVRNGDGHASKRVRSSALRSVKNVKSVPIPREQTKEEYDEELALAMEAELEREFES